MFNKIIMGLVWIAIGIAIIWGVGAVALKNKGEVNLASSVMDNFAKCLTDKGVKMYGADWCPHCQNQKKAFGASFKFIDYTRCELDGNKQKCESAGIKGYPTWVFLAGEKIEGEASFEDLSDKSGCEYKK